MSAPNYASVRLPGYAAPVQGRIVNPTNPSGYSARYDGLYVPTFGYMNWRPLFQTTSSVTITEAELKQQREEAKRREQEAKAAEARAESLLREIGPDGVALADGDAVTIQSKRFPDITYGIIPLSEGRVIVFHRTLGRMGEICIQPKDEAPKCDALLTRLMLCKGDEESLWRTGEWWDVDDSIDSLSHFLPKQIREWLGKTDD